MPYINSLKSNDSTAVFSAVIVFFVLLFYILNTTFSVYSVRLPVAYFALILGFFLAFIKYPLTSCNVLVSRESLTVIFFILFFLIYASFIEIVAGLSGGLFYFSIILINILVCTLFCFVFCVFLLKQFFDINNIFKIVLYIALFNSIIIIASFFISELRLFVESFLYHQERSNIDYLNVDWRLRGIAAAGGASLSIFLAFSVMCAIICNKAKLLSSSICLAYIVVIIFAQFFVARTGLILSLVMFSYWLIAELLRFRTGFYLVLIILCFVLISSFSAFYNELSSILPFALELFYNFFSGEGFETGSTNDLFEMLVFPEHPAYLLFGFGCFENCQFYRSDSGYLKSISAVGIILSVVIYFLFFYFLFFKVSRLIFFGKFYWNLFLILLFLSEVKEPFIYQNYLGRVIILLVCFYYVNQFLTRERHADLSRDYKS
ncbi:hypothetical protein AGRI_04667 [Alishewanella agri BL06]|uniref:O-antigen polymerase n=1 Tax=Alishewanella agri BL06 TaxID=1195246 RepID=I9DTC0_9ALTE|nr:hypothetical protein [Alishewanella agri]EIW89365.1 hypothetical protein AGRI_04667 [Alishewanella agri BL06]